MSQALPTVTAEESTHLIDIRTYIFQNLKLQHLCGAHSGSSEQLPPSLILVYIL